VVRGDAKKGGYEGVHGIAQGGCNSNSGVCEVSFEWIEAI
jgi:hypothetical protein